MQEVTFHNVATYYDYLASLVFGNAIRRSQRNFLSDIPAGSHVLIVGGGTGWILKELSKLKNCRITYLETAASMLKKANQNYRLLKKVYDGQGTEVVFIQGSVASLPTDTSYDVVITYFLLDLYAAPDALLLMRAMEAKLKPGGKWLFSDFVKSRSLSKRVWQQPLLWLMYSFFKLTTNLQNSTLPDLIHLFNVLNFTELKKQSFYFSFIRSAVYQKREPH